MAISFTAKPDVKDQLKGLGLSAFNCGVTVKNNSMSSTYGYSTFAEGEKDNVQQLMLKINGTFGGGTNLCAKISEVTSEFHVKVESFYCRQ